MIRVRLGCESLFPERSVAEVCGTAGEVYREAGGRRTLAFERNGRRFFIKCHRGQGWREICKNLVCLRLPVLGAKTEWRALRRLESLAVPAPRWVAFGQQGRNPATRCSFLVTESLEGTRDLEYWAREIKRHEHRPTAVRAKWALIAQVARLTRVLHENGINHRDYYLCHLRLAAGREEFFRAPETWPVYVMDLHRAQLRLRTPLRWAAKDLAGLLYSCQYGPAGMSLTSRDLVRFLRIYREDWRKSLCTERALWRRVIRRLCRSYRREFSAELVLPPHLRVTGPCRAAEADGKRIPELTDAAALPFSVPVVGSVPLRGELVCERALRVRPGKRLACSGHWNGRPVFIKLFAAGFSGDRRWRRELHALRQLHARGIPAPRLLHAGAAVGGGRFLVCEYLAASRTLDRAWLQRTEPGRHRALLRDLLVHLGAHHRRGVVPRDPHLGNFACTPDGIVTLDAGDVRLLRAPVARRAARANLALLLAQFPCETDPVGMGLYADYAAASGGETGKLDKLWLAGAIRGARRRRRRKVLRKAFRNCSAVVHRQDRWHRLLCDRTCYRGEMLNLLADPDAYLGHRRVRTLKDGNSSTVAVVQVNGQQVVVKRYNIKGWRHALLRGLRATRAARAWRNAHALLFDGVPTARPLAMLEHRLGPLRRRSYLVTEFVPGPTCLASFGLADDGAVPDQEALYQVSALLRKLHARRLQHGDLKATNIIMASSGPLLVDLDGLRRFRPAWPPQRAIQKDTRRFLANWKHLPDVEGRFRAMLGG